jgi:hypothetical protein
MIYLTHVRLMRESEQTIDETAAHGDEVARRVCEQLLAAPSRYSLWHAQHDYSMTGVAAKRRRERQVLALRGYAVRQIHRSALVKYLRDHRVLGAARDETLRDFYPISDLRDAALTEHRRYVVAASNQLCAGDLLSLAGEHVCVDLLRQYELAYGQFFSLFCEYSRSRRSGEPYLLTALIPEVRATANRLRQRILEGGSLVRHAPRMPPQHKPPERVSAVAR